MLCISYGLVKLKETPGSPGKMAFETLQLLLSLNLQFYFSILFVCAACPTENILFCSLTFSPFLSESLCTCSECPPPWIPTHPNP